MNKRLMVAESRDEKTIKCNFISPYNNLQILSVIAMAEFVMEEITL